MAVYRVQDTSLTAVADAIRAKAGTSDALTFPDGFVEAVGGIQAGGGGAAGVSPKDVNFYDYDGTLLHAYTVAEAQALTALPDGPQHPGLVFQGWNWSLEGVKGLTRAMNIGAMYTTDDGTTRLYITLQEGRTSPMLGVAVNGTVTVDWGDGTEPDVLTGTNAASSTKWTPNHAYAAPGDYVIRLKVNGAAGFLGSSSANQNANILRHGTKSDGRNCAYQNALKRVEFGENIRSISGYAFKNCHSLESVAIPASVTGIHNNAFNECYSLKSVTIPDGVTSIGDYAFQGCRALASVTIPDGVTSIGNYAFTSCFNLESVTIPDSVTSIGSYAFQYCYSFKSVVIPDSVTSIETYAFSACYTLESVTIPDSVTSIGNQAFSNSYSLKSVTIPDGVTSIGNYAFSACYTLESVTIPDSVTSIGSIAFQECRALASVTIPDSVTSINNNVFAKCYSLTVCDFTSHIAVPTLASANAFSDTPDDCEIRVPAALYDEWVAATNWSTYADKIKAY